MLPRLVVPHLLGIALPTTTAGICVGGEVHRLEQASELLVFVLAEGAQCNAMWRRRADVETSVHPPHCIASSTLQANPTPVFTV